MKVFTVMIMAIVLSPCNAQSRKEARERGITTKTVINVNYDNGNGIETIRKIYKYNPDGNVIEELDYDNNKIDKKIVYQYNKNNDVVKETHYEANGDLQKSIEYTFDGKLKTAKIIKDNKGRTVEKRKYVFEFSE